jgi:hypothetical protein
MDKFTVTDEGGGLIHVDAQTNLMRKPMASSICGEINRKTNDYSGFKMLMNMGAISKGTPAAGFYVLGSLKKYPVQALALYGANRFMRRMAKTVLGIARFKNFAIFEDEAGARQWLARVSESAPAE